ncbi:glycerophosphodiester phosphodiesterase GDPD1, chloroplastic-like [Cynara cardunculus var. scolymus]|uniref:glycerophosphodiester phosphodiesterase n=1 Tax=Cynara cardunculus var. scolymus TaxID=59895 RepID=A0A118JXE6_CYNCS|nr:glycerophosphodiester phosphodiesterase GDPD1, chloroplastic-like [Cynara cardunculus var. scolymus]KVH95739.1 Glycerophosphoryl diester phosphodiesterase [Cynara cardunculus var. scolymus]
MDTVFKFISPDSSKSPLNMALKAVHVTQVPNLDQVPDDLNHSNNAPPAFNIYPPMFHNNSSHHFMIMGHRGTGMNLLQSPDPRMKSLKENSILAFNAAGKFNLDFIEFDVQVTKDDCPIIFHDSFIFTEEKGVVIEKRVTNLKLDEFLSYGPQREPDKVGKPLFRKTKDGRIFEWKVEKDDHLCTLEEVFQNVNHSMGFNIEFKFDDNIVYKEDDLVHVIQVVLRVVFNYAKDRSIIFSSFQPDAALLIRKLQTTYPVFFLTNGGSEIYTDIRRNSLDEAMKLCLAGGLNGIVSEVRAILRNPGVIRRIEDSKLSLISYGQLNNVQEVVYAQLLMGVGGVIVDLVQDITEAVANFGKTVKEENVVKEDEDDEIKCSQYQLSNLMKLIPGLIQP